MENKFEAWINKSAKWYHFWLPQSGAIGGIIVVGLLLLFNLLEHLL